MDKRYKQTGRTRRFGRARALLPLILIAALCAAAVSACGSSNSKTHSTASTTTKSTASKLAGAPVKIGVISTDSFSGISIADTPTASQDWAAYINSHGGINGHPVSVMEKNDQGSPATAAQDFATLQKAGAVVIADSSIVDAAFQKGADKAHIPVVGLTASNSAAAYETDANFFPNGTTQAGGIFGILKGASLTGAKNFGAMYCSEVAACGEPIKYLKELAPQYGMKVGYTAAVSSSAPSYTSQCLAAKSGDVDALWVAAASASASDRVIDNCAQQGYTPTIVFYGSPISPAEKADKNIKSGVIINQTLPYFVRNSDTAAFYDAMGSYLPKAVSGNTVMIDWVGLQEIADAAEAGGLKSGSTPTSAEIYKGLYTFKDNTIGGLTVPLTFVKGKPNPQSCTFFSALKSTKYSTPWGTKPLCPAKSKGK